MRKSGYSLIVIVALVGAAGLWWYRRADAGQTTGYRFATVERGNLEATVSATGILNAVTTVQVGTQVSGLVTEILTDFNQRVKKGQLLARIDPTLLEQAVRDADAVVERNNAELQQAQRDYDRNKQLFDRQVLTQSEYDVAVYGLAVAKANLKSAQVSLDRAQRNLSYTRIYAPIDGVVIERNVNVGQTVAASLSAPQLFLIANDLAQMEILASVDESDIGEIHEGQDVRFTVQPYPSEKFMGTVRQVRLQSTTVENVVNYTAVVSVNNKSGRLLPGMTATVDFITGSADSALIVSNSALRFRPSEEQLQSLRGSATTTNGGAGQGADSARERLVAQPTRAAGGATAPAGSARGSGSGRSDMSTLWYLDGSGKLSSLRVTTGLTNGQMTVVSGPNLTEGMQIIVAAASGAAATSGSTSPFQSSNPQGGRPGPGF